MNIGMLAQKTSVSTDTIRFYEKEGLLAKPARQANGYRLYREEDVARLNFVRSAHALGFSLDEIRKTLPALNAGGYGRVQVEKLLKQKIDDIEKQIRSLHKMKRGLVDSLASLSCPPELGLKDRDVTQRKVLRSG